MKDCIRLSLLLIIKFEITWEQTVSNGHLGFYVYPTVPKGIQ